MAPPRRMLVIVAAAAAASLLTAEPGRAASCGEQVVRDWYDNGKVDDVYPLACYRTAIAMLPIDARSYSSAEDDILEGMARARRALGDGRTPAGRSRVDGPPAPAASKREREEAGPARTAVAAGAGEQSGALAVPIPLIALVALACLLLASGGTGYLARRARAGDADGAGRDGPP